MICILAMAIVGWMSSTPAEQTPQRLATTDAANGGLDYWLYLPPGYHQNPRQQWPLLLFLHGSGERGTNVEAVLKHGPPKLAQNGRQLPLIIVSPQCPPGQWWSPRLLNRLLDKVCAQYRVDQNRVYLTGLSMGGFGTWSLAASAPERFAAIAPICGGGDPATAPKLRHLAIWVFHGAKDKAVPVEKSQEMVDALKAVGANVRLTIYPDAEHDSWTRTYDDPQFWEWLLAQRRKNREPSVSR